MCCSMVSLRVKAEEIKQTLSLSVGIAGTSLIVVAISAAAARELAKYERLEQSLGDSILKFCTHLQVSFKHAT